MEKYAHSEMVAGNRTIVAFRSHKLPYRVLAIVAIFAACLALGEARAGQAAVAGTISNLADLDGKRIGILVGTILDKVVESKLDYAQLEYYDDYRAMEKVLLEGGLDAIIGDYPVLLQIAADTAGLRVLEERLEDSWYGLAFRLEDKPLADSVNALVREFKRSGVLDRLGEKWLTGPEAERTLKWPDVGAGAKLFRIGTSSVMPPFSYLDAEQCATGFDLELGILVAERLGLSPVPVDMEFGSLIPSLVAGEIDMIASCLSITHDRQRIIHFTDGYYLSGAGVLVRE